MWAGAPGGSATPSASSIFTLPSLLPALHAATSYPALERELLAISASLCAVPVLFYSCSGLGQRQQCYPVSLCRP